MPKKSYAEHLLQVKPELLHLSHYYESLGIPNPVLWAKSEADGEPSVALAALLHGLARTIESKQAGTGWLDRLKSGDINVDDQGLLEEARDALVHLSSLEGSAISLMALIRVAQAEALNGIASLIDYGPEICCLSLPLGREQGWELFATDKDGNALQCISGFAEVVRAGRGAAQNLTCSGLPSAAAEVKR